MRGIVQSQFLLDFKMNSLRRQRNSIDSLVKKIQEPIDDTTICICCCLQTAELHLFDNKRVPVRIIVHVNISIQTNTQLFVLQIVDVGSCR